MHRFLIRFVAFIIILTSAHAFSWTRENTGLPLNIWLHPPIAATEFEVAAARQKAQSFFGDDLRIEIWSSNSSGIKSVVFHYTGIEQPLSRTDRQDGLTRLRNIWGDGAVFVDPDDADGPLPLWLQSIHSTEQSQKKNLFMSARESIDTSLSTALSSNRNPGFFDNARFFTDSTPVLFNSGGLLAPVTRWRRLIDKIAQEQGLDEDLRIYNLDPVPLILALVRAESYGNPSLINPSKLEGGLLQLKPSTAKIFNVDNPFDPVENLTGGIRYFQQLLRKYQNPILAVAAFNAGPECVDKYLPRVPNISYPRSVFRFYAEFGGGTIDIERYAPHRKCRCSTTTPAPVSVPAGH